MTSNRVVLRHVCYSSSRNIAAAAIISYRFPFGTAHH